MKRYAMPLIVLPFLGQPLSAQGAPKYELVVSAGLHIPVNPIGPAAQASPAWYLDLERVDPALALSASARVNWSKSVATRFALQWVVPSRAEGMFRCRPGTACPDVLLPTSADVSVQTAMLDIIVTPLHVHPSVRPYVALGGGIRRDHYEWRNAAVLVEGGEHSTSSMAFRAGLGVDVAVFGSALRLEIEDLRRPSGAFIYDSPSGDLPSPRPRGQHDIGLTLGWRLLSF